MVVEVVGDLVLLVVAALVSAENKRRLGGIHMLTGGERPTYSLVNLCIKLCLIYWYMHWDVKILCVLNCVYCVICRVLF